MLTYGSLPEDDDDPLGALFRKPATDVVDIGERNDCWMSVVVSKKVLELKDKVTGKITRVPIDEHFAQIAEDRHKLGPVRIAIALKLVGLK